MLKPCCLSTSNDGFQRGVRALRSWLAGFVIALIGFGVAQSGNGEESSPGEVFPLPGAVWNTSPDQPWTGCTSTAGVEGIYGSSSSLQPPSWLEVTLNGPGKLQFSVDTGLTLPVNVDPPCLKIAVNGTALPGLSSDRDRILLGYDISSMVLHLPDGPQTVRWTLPPWDGGAAGVRLFGLTYVSSPALMPPSSGTQRAFLYRTSTAVEPSNTSGASVVHIRYAGSVSSVNEHTACIAWSNAQPGRLKFRWRRPPGVTWPENTPVFRFRQVVSLPPPAVAWLEYGEPELTLFPSRDGAWKTEEVMLPYAGAACTWRLTPDIPELEVADIQFIPATAISPGEALGIAGVAVTTDPEHPWTGLRFPDGRTAVVPFFRGTWGASSGWLEATVSGPAEIRWQNFGRNSNGLESDMIIFRNGGFAFPYRGWLPSGIRSENYFTPVPPGVHVLRWELPAYHSGIQEVLENAAKTPLPAAWFDWNPWNQPLPPVHWPEPALDYDSDGMDNLMEYTFGTSITAADPPIQPVTSIEANHLCVTLPVPRPLSDGVRVLIETSGDLLTWQSAAVELVASTPPGRVKYRLTDILPATVARVYVRARVETVPE